MITIESDDQQNLKIVTDCPSNAILTGCQINRQSGDINQIRGIYSISAETNPKSVVAGLNHNQCIGQAQSSEANLRGGAQCIQTNDGYELGIDYIHIYHIQIDVIIYFIYSCINI